MLSWDFQKFHFTVSLQNTQSVVRLAPWTKGINLHASSDKWFERQTPPRLVHLVGILQGKNDRNVQLSMKNITCYYQLLQWRRLKEQAETPRSMSITVETRFVFNVKFYQDVLGQCTSMKRRVSIWNGSRHKTFTLVGHGCGKPNFNTLHPNNSMHIPHTVRHTFPEVLTRRICLKIYPVVGDQRIK